MQKSIKADLNNWLNQHSSLLDVNNAVFATWFAKYGIHLQKIVENGEAYISPMLVGDYKDMKILVIFGDDELSPSGKVPEFFYKEPCFNESSGTFLPPAIIIGHKKRA